MGLIIFFVIWYFAYARNNPKIYSKLKKKKGIIIFILIALFRLMLFTGFLSQSLLPMKQLKIRNLKKRQKRYETAQFLSLNSFRTQFRRESGL